MTVYLPLKLEVNRMKQLPQVPAETQDTTEDARPASATMLTELLEAHRGEHHLIVPQDFPDPDAISSAYTHQLISSLFDVGVDIYNAGEVSHQQNIALVKLLGIDLIRFDNTQNLAGYDGAIFVDNQGTTARALTQAIEATQIPVLAVIDHHELQDRLKPEFSDIRRTGATATIYVHYLQNLDIPLDKSKKEYVIAATSLMHGILTDTKSFVYAKEEDFGAAAFLSAYQDAGLLEQIMNQARSKQTMETIHRALEGRVIAESYSIAGIGYLRISDRDAIPQTADFLLSEENVHTAIVYGIVMDGDGQEKLIGSMRTARITIDPDTFIEDVLGRDAVGHYFGGGKLTAGGFEIPVGFLSGGTDSGYQQLKWRIYDAQIKHRIFTKIGVDMEVEVTC